MFRSCILVYLVTLGGLLYLSSAHQDVHLYLNGVEAQAQVVERLKTDACKGRHNSRAKCYKYHFYEPKLDYFSGYTYSELELGEEITIYYDPSDPSDKVYEVGWDLFWSLLVVLTAIVILGKLWRDDWAGLRRKMDGKFDDRKLPYQFLFMVSTYPFSIFLGVLSFIIASRHFQ